MLIHNVMSELMLISRSVPSLTHTSCSRRLFYKISGPQLVEVSLFWRWLNFCMLYLWGCLFACASTSSTLCSIWEMIMLQVFLLHAWSRRSIFSLWQISLQSPRWEFRTPLAVRLSWSLMPSFGMKVKEKLHSLLQFRLSYPQEPPLLRLHHLLHRMMLALLRLWVPWPLFSEMLALFSERSALSVSKFSSASLISRSVSSTIIHLMMTRNDCYCWLFETFYFYSCF